MRNSFFTRILVTGSTGFIGQRFIEYAVSHTISTLSLRNMQIENVNIEDVDVILHLAGKAHDLKNVSSPEDYYKVNYELTKHLFDKFLQSNAKKFIFISSVKATADSIVGVLTEEHVSAPKTPYGKSKLMAEEYILSHLTSDKFVYILRPCMVHGKGNKGNLNLLYNFVDNGIPYPLAAFQNKRSFLTIENLCFVINELCERNDIPSGVYNVADNKPLSTNEVVSVIAESIGKKSKMWYLPKFLIKTIAKLGDIVTLLPINSEKLGKLTENYIVSNQKIKAAIGKDLPISSHIGLLKSFESFR
jgi:nucleoside-diphosphate-sugar epimerase